MAGGRTPAPSGSDNYDHVPAPKTVPFADEREPGLGRLGGVLQEERRQSGGLDDDPADNPVIDSNPFRPTTTR